MEQKEITENEEILSEEEEDIEDFPSKKRKKKLEITNEEIKIKYDKYLNCKLKYPKSQFCFFYFKDECLLGSKCQFCHGYEEFSIDRFFTFLNDKTAVKYSSQKYYQKYYFNHIIPEDEYTYSNLLEYQEKHPDLFKRKFTFEELKKSRENRLVIRKLLAKDIINQFLIELFNKFNYIKLEDLTYYIYNVGYPLSIKALLKRTDIFFSKNHKEKGKNTTFFIKNLTHEEMINIFAKIIIDYMKNGKYEDFFPIDYPFINKIIFTSSKFYEPNLGTYFQFNKISDKKFMDIIIDKLIEESNKGNFDLIKNKDKKDLTKENFNKKIIQEIYENHFKLNNTKLSYFNLDVIENFIKEKKSNNKITINNNELQYGLFNDGNLLFINNDNKIYFFNYNKFQSFNLDEFYNNNYYFKNCFKEKDNLELDNKIENLNINSSNEIIEENMILNQNNIYNIDNTIIHFINDKNSLTYFENKSKYFEILSIDIEGQFNINDIKINLIQICDDTNLKNDIYIIDFNTFKINEKQVFLHLSKLLKNIFENKNIKKIFFDGKNDLLSLHKELNVCIINYIDLSSLYNAVNSYKELYQYKILKGEKNEKNFNKTIKLFKQNYFCKGLNTVLKKFHTNHCYNPLKDKYHKLFEEKEFDYWAKRPIIQEFLLYSALDVKYEFDTYNNLKNELKKILINFYEIKDISEDNIDLIILLISCGNHNSACKTYEDIKQK